MTFIEMIGLMMVCITVLAVVLLVLASLPHSPIRDILLQLAGWLFAGSCGFYILSPIDLVPEILLGPFGLVDDLLALIIGIASVLTAWQTRREARRRAQHWEAARREQPPLKTITVAHKAVAPRKLKRTR